MKESAFNIGFILQALLTIFLQVMVLADIKKYEVTVITKNMSISTKTNTEKLLSKVIIQKYSFMSL